MRTVEPGGAVAPDLAVVTGAADDLPAAPQVDGLRLTRRIGVGAHGQVWLAGDVRTGDRVAVKLVRDDLTGEQARQAAERLANEAAMLARVRHPHLIRLRGTVDDALVLDHLPGGSVADLVAARGPLEPAEVTTVVVPVARALAALHAAGIVHGDVTAANVLLGGDGHPVLADLGAATEVRVVTPAGGPGRANRPGPPVLSPVVWGTPGWVDPVATAGRPNPGQDIWGLGALVRFCLTATVVPDTSVGPAEGDDTRRAMLRVAQACCADRSRRPSAEQVASMVWQVASAAPIAMAASTGPSAPELTRRIRVEAAAGPAEDRRRGTVGTLPRWWAPVRAALTGRPVLPGGARWGWAVAALAAGLLAGGATAVVVARTAGAIPEQPDLAAPGQVVPESAERSVGTATGAAATGGTVLSGTVPNGTVPPSVTPADDLSRLVARLAGARAAAIGSGSTAALAAVDAPGSPAEAADRALLQRLASAGRRLVGLSFVVGQVARDPGPTGSAQSATGPDGATRLSVTTEVTTSAHTQVDSRTAAVVLVPPGRPQRMRIVLARLSQGWRVVEVEPVTAQDQ